MGRLRTDMKGGSASMSKASNPVSTNSQGDQEPGSDGLLARQEKIARRAYGFYEQGNYQDGNALTHWLQAEQEIVSESKIIKS